MIYFGFDRDLSQRKGDDDDEDEDEDEAEVIWIGLITGDVSLRVKTAWPLGFTLPCPLLSTCHLLYG